MDTTSNALSQILHLLAQHPDVQKRLRAEILEANLCGKDISYDELCALPYLDAICRETLRLCVPFFYSSVHDVRAALISLSTSPSSASHT